MYSLGNRGLRCLQCSLQLYVVELPGAVVFLIFGKFSSEGFITMMKCLMWHVNFEKLGCAHRWAAPCSERLALH